MNTYDRELTISEKQLWVEQGETGDEQARRAGIANAGYPVYLSELTSINATEDHLFDVPVKDIQLVERYGIVIPMGIATEPYTGWSFLVALDIYYNMEWYIVEYGPDERYSNDWMPSVDEEKQAFNYSE